MLNKIEITTKIIKRMKNTKILTIANRKGGAGKSTCAAHLALEAVKNNLKTILVDLDPQKTLETWWNLRQEENPYLLDEIDPENIEDFVTKLNRSDFDLCIIDTPGDTSINTSAGIKAADIVLTPTKPTPPDLSAIGRTIALINKYEKPFVFLVTQAVPNSTLQFESSAVLSSFGEVIPVIMTNRTSYAKAMNSGSSAVFEDKKALEEIEQIWRFIEKKLFVNTNMGLADAKEKVRI